MALEAVVFPQDPFGYIPNNKDLFNLVSSSACFSFHEDEDLHFLSNQTENSPTLLDDHHHHQHHWNNSSSISDPNFNQLQQRLDPSPPEIQGGSGGGGSGRPGRRRRGKVQKNKEEIENQRMTHITVERNRRKQMNEYLSVLRSLMPDSYVQRGDQASIIGGAINFVKELEQQVHLLSGQTDVKPFPHVGPNHNNNNTSSSSPFSHFFTFPSYYSPSPSSSSSSPSRPLLSDLDYSATAMASSNDNLNNNNSTTNSINVIQSSIADVEVSIADSHANLKIRCKKLPKQLLKIVSGLHSLRLSVLHLNVSTAHHIVLYSFSLKVEEDCGLSSVDEIARAVYQLLCRIQEEAFSN